MYTKYLINWNQDRQDEADSVPAIPRRQAMLSEAQMDFLNPEAVRSVNPYSHFFWQEILDWLEGLSDQANAYPKAAAYRDALVPYLLRKVHMTAHTWSVKEVSEDGRIRLLLKDVCLTNVFDRRVGKAPRVLVDHMNIWVGADWMNRVAPDILEPLALDGVLYEYICGGETRNIGILPVLVMPRSRMVRGKTPRDDRTPQLSEAAA